MVRQRMRAGTSHAFQLAKTTKTWSAGWRGSYGTDIRKHFVKWAPTLKSNDGSVRWVRAHACCLLCTDQLCVAVSAVTLKERKSYHSFVTPSTSWEMSFCCTIKIEDMLISQNLRARLCGATWAVVQGNIYCKQSGEGCRGSKGVALWGWGPEKEAGTGLRRPARCWRSTAPVCQATALGG